MTVQGIRILDKKNNVVSVELQDILKEISDGELLNWAVLYLEATGHLDDGRSIRAFEEQIINSENGFFINWNELNKVSKKINQIIDITLLGCKNKNDLRRYENSQAMYENCDIVIEMIDSSYWEIFSKNEQLIAKLASKFINVNLLNSDYRN